MSHRCCCCGLINCDCGFDDENCCGCFDCNMDIEPLDDETPTEDAIDEAEYRIGDR